MASSKVYFDWHHRRMFATMQIRNAFFRLAKQLTLENKPEKALEVIRKVEQTINLSRWPVDYQCILLAALYKSNGQEKLGQEKFRELANSLESWLTYYSGFPAYQKKTILDEAGYQFALYHELIKQAEGTLPDTELSRMKQSLMTFAEGLRM